MSYMRLPIRNIENEILDIKGKVVEGTVALVKRDSDAKAARNLILYFHHMLSNGYLFGNVLLSPVERAFVDYVGHVFARIAENKITT